MQFNPPPIPPVEPYLKPPVPPRGTGATETDFQPTQVGCVPMLVAFIAVFLLGCLIAGVLFALGGETLINIIYPSFCLACIGWVFFDAMALKTGRGQVAGMVNMPPWAWALSFFLFWLIAFPIYLATRPEIIKVNEQYPDGPPIPADAVAKTNVRTIVGVGCLLALVFVIVAIAVLTVVGKQLSETNPELRSSSTVVQ